MTLIYIWGRALLLEFISYDATELSSWRKTWFSFSI